jgi:hypothetical protein
MKSHPNEFMVGIGRDHVAENDRWGPALASVYRHGSEADKAALKAEVDVLRMAEAHEWTMDELCNGDERRRKEQEELEYERNLLNRVNNQKLAMQQQQVGNYTSIIGSPGTVYEIETDTFSNNTGFVSTMKKALGL